MPEGEFICPTCSKRHNETLWLVVNKYYCSWDCGFIKYVQGR